jgi:hypothetical protein
MDFNLEKSQQNHLKIFMLCRIIKSMSMLKEPIIIIGHEHWYYAQKLFKMNYECWNEQCWRFVHGYYMNSFLVFTLNVVA